MSNQNFLKQRDFTKHPLLVTAANSESPQQKICALPNKLERSFRISRSGMGCGPSWLVIRVLGLQGVEVKGFGHGIREFRVEGV